MGQQLDNCPHQCFGCFLPHDGAVEYKIQPTSLLKMEQTVRVPSGQQVKPRSQLISWFLSALPVASSTSSSSSTPLLSSFSSTSSALSSSSSLTAVLHSSSLAILLDIRSSGELQTGAI